MPNVVNGVQVFGVPRGATPGIVSNARLNLAAAALHEKKGNRPAAKPPIALVPIRYSRP